MPSPSLTMSLSPLSPYAGYTGWLQVKLQVLEHFFGSIFLVHLRLVHTLPTPSLIIFLYVYFALYHTKHVNSHPEMERVAYSKSYYYATIIYIVCLLLPYTGYTTWLQLHFQVYIHLQVYSCIMCSLLPYTGYTGWL